MTRLLILALAVALLGSWSQSQAQGSFVATADEKRIAECVDSTVRTGSMTNPYGPDKACALEETDHCIEAGRRHPNHPILLEADCASAELEVWDRILKQSYEAALAQVTKLDDDFKNLPQNPLVSPLAAPAFVTAQEA